MTKPKIKYDRNTASFQIPYPPPNYVNTNQESSKKRWFTNMAYAFCLSISLLEFGGWSLVCSVLVLSVITFYLFEKWERKKTENISFSSRIQINEISKLLQKKNQMDNHELTFHFKNGLKRPVGVISKGEFLLIEDVLNNKGIQIVTE